MNHDNYGGNDAQEYARHLLQTKVDFTNWSVEYVCPSSGKRWIYSYTHPELQGGGIPQLDACTEPVEYLPQTRTYAMANLLWHAKAHDELARYSTGLLYAPVEMNEDENFLYSMYFVLGHKIVSESRVTACMAPVLESDAKTMLQLHASFKITKDIDIREFARGQIIDVVQVPVDQFTERFFDLRIAHNFHP